MADSKPEGYHSVTPYLFLRDTESALAFYQKAFNAEVIMKVPGPGGKIGHAEIRVGDSLIMLADEYPEMGFPSPETLGSTPISLMLYVDDVDTTFAAAIEAGAEEIREVSDQFYGDRAGTIKDPAGHIWTVATHIEDLSSEEISKRSQEFVNNCENKD
ncbi:MAG: VOC family protein [bacterium]